MIYLEPGELVMIAFIVFVVFASSEVAAWIRYWRRKRHERRA